MNVTTGRWVVDVAHSTVSFSVGNLGRTVRGVVPLLAGTIELGPDGIPSAVAGSLDLAAIDTGNRKRDRDLRRPRLLDLDRRPTMTFAASAVRATAAGWRVTGTLTARGASALVTGDVEIRASEDGPTTLTATARLDRRDLGIRAPRLLIGRTLDITITATIWPAA